MKNSRRGGKVPEFLVRGAARQQNQRIVNDYRRRSDQNSQQVGQVMTWCVLIALHETQGMGTKRLDEFGEALQKVGGEYEQNVHSRGFTAASGALDAQTCGVLAGYEFPTLARVDKDKHEQRDKMLIRDQRDAAVLVLRLCLATLHMHFGYGEKRLRDVLNETDANYRQFLQWALDGRGDGEKSDGTGQAYAYEKLAAVIRQIRREDDIVVETRAGTKPVFVEKF